MIRLRVAREYIESFLKIRTKDAQIVPLKLNAAQKRLYAVIKAETEKGKPVRVIILKARQMGFSTLTEALIFWQAATRRNVDALIVAHTEEATGNLFRMSKRFYDNLPAQLQPQLKASNAQELYFDIPGKSQGSGLGSRIRCATAGGNGVGRSYTLQAVHMSEYAYWPGDKREIYTGIMQAVPDAAGTMVIIESTANGYDDFKALWDRAVEAQRTGSEGFVPVFFPWFEMEEYRRKAPPGMELSDEERALAQRYGLDREQIAWRRWCIASQCGGDERIFRQEYPSAPDEAFITSGECIFDAQAIAARRESVQKLDVRRGEFEFDYDDERREKIKNIRWRDDPRGCIRLLAEPESAPYVIGADTAGTGSDYFAGQVLDNRTGKQVAVLHHRSDETFFTRQMYCLGKYYGDALIGIETNYSTYPQLELERLGYDNFYVRERIDTYTGQTMKAFGFSTNAKTRPLIIDGLKAVAREDIGLISDYETLGEMLTFALNDHYRPEALPGEHDDLVMALAIAHFIRPQQSYELKPAPAEGKEWTRDMWDDYNRADRTGREYLIKKWGEPRR